jgi:hypothetical protein
MSGLNNGTFDDDKPKGRSRSGAITTNFLCEGMELPIKRKSSQANEIPIESTTANNSIMDEATKPEIPAGEYDCDLIKEYELSNGRCCLLLKDIKIGQLDESIELFLTAGKEKGKIISFHQEKAHCWDCKCSCGQVLIRTASLHDNSGCIVQVHRRNGCGYGTHRLRQKMFRYLESGSTPLLSFTESLPSVPFDFLACTAAMKQEFQERCRSLLGSGQADRRDLAKQALFGQQQL